MNKISLTDEELGLLYSLITRAVQAADRELRYGPRRKRRRLLAAERIARALARQVHAKVRRAMPRAAARAADLILEIADRF